MEELKPLVALSPEKFSGKAKALEDMITAKQWYEFGLEMISVYSMPELAHHKKEIFDTLIVKYGASLDPFHFTSLVISTADDIGDPDAGLAFVKELRDGKLFEKLPQPRDLLNLRIVVFLSAKSQFEDALELLNTVEARVNTETPIVIRAALHKTQAVLDKARNDYDSFYAHALLHLSTSQVTNDPQLAYDLCAAALFANSICSFGEIAAHPVLDSLNGTENAWLGDLIRLMDKGSPESIDTYNERFAPLIAKSPVFSPHAAVVQRKMALSVFLELIFERPFDKRTFTFQTIADACRVPIDKVELLVLRAMATGVIRGTIDEIAQLVVITWCKPKALGIARLSHLKDELDRWIGLVRDQRVALETGAHDVVG